MKINFKFTTIGLALLAVIITVVSWGYWNALVSVRKRHFIRWVTGEHHKIKGIGISEINLETQTFKYTADSSITDEKIQSMFDVGKEYGDSSFVVSMWEYSNQIFWEGQKIKEDIRNSENAKIITRLGASEDNARNGSPNKEEIKITEMKNGTAKFDLSCRNFPDTFTGTCNLANALAFDKITLPSKYLVLFEYEPDPRSVQIAYTFY